MLTSLQNPLVKQIRKLHTSKQRRLQQQFLLEGTHLVEEACRHGYPLQTVCCTEAWQSSYSQLFAQLAHAAHRVELVSEDVLKSLATTVNPDGVVATAAKTGRSEPSLLPNGVGLAIARLQDPGNLGTILRTAVAADLDGLWLSGDSVDVENPKVLRASAGTWFQMPLSVCDDFRDAISRQQQQGVRVVATCLDGEMSYWDVDWRQPSLILLGNEGAGLDEDLIEQADLRATIPISDRAESLNVAIAAALFAFEVRRQRQNAA
jgi:TrmH family RNA methyltransferase